MLSPAIIFGFLLLSISGFVNSYTIARAQDYSQSYHPSSFTSLKDPQDHSQSSNYATSSSPRYSSVYGGGHPSSASYPEASQSSGYGGHSASTDALNSLTASYQSDSASDLNPSYSSSQNIDYSSSPHSSSSGSVSFSGYGGGSSDGIEYASPSTASYAASGPLSYSGPKASAYTGGHPGQPGSPFSSSSNVNYVSGGHAGSSSSSSGHSPSYPGYSFSGARHPVASHPSEHSQGQFSDGHRFQPSAIKSFMSSLHRETPGSYHGASSQNPNYLHSLGNSGSYPKSGGPYFSGGFPKGGGKIIIIKDGSGTHAMMHPESSYPSGMFSGGSGYKVRSAGPFSSGHHYGSASGSYSHPPGYSGASGHPPVGGTGTSYFGYS